MVSRNNTKLLDKARVERERQRFGLRKLNVGVASVLLGTTMFIGASGVAHADTVPTSGSANDSTSDVDTNVADNTAGEANLKDVNTSSANSNVSAVSVSSAVNVGTLNVRALAESKVSTNVSAGDWDKLPNTTVPFTKDPSLTLKVYDPGVNSSTYGPNSKSIYYGEWNGKYYYSGSTKIDALGYNSDETQVNKTIFNAEDGTPGSSSQASINKAPGVSIYGGQTDNHKDW